MMCPCRRVGILQDPPMNSPEYQSQPVHLFFRANNLHTLFLKELCVRDLPQFMEYEGSTDFVDWHDPVLQLGFYPWVCSQDFLALPHPLAIILALVGYVIQDDAATGRETWRRRFVRCSLLSTTGLIMGAKAPPIIEPNTPSAMLNLSVKV